MRIALYARTTPAAPGQEDVDQVLADLKACAAERGWEIVLEEAADSTPTLQGRRQGLQRLREAVRARTIQAVLVRTLEGWAEQGHGPPYRKAGRKTAPRRYPLGSYLDWRERTTMTSTIQRYKRAV